MLAPIIVLAYVTNLDPLCVLSSHREFTQAPADNADNEWDLRLTHIKSASTTHWSVSLSHSSGLKFTTQTASRSVQPFLQGSRSWQTDRQTDRPRYSICNSRSLHLRTTAMWLNDIINKVIWQKAASPQHMDGSVVFARWRQCALHLIRYFLWPTRVHKIIGISIGSATFAQLTAECRRACPFP